MGNLKTLAVTSGLALLVLLLLEGSARLYLWQRVDGSAEKFCEQYFMWSDQVGYYADPVNQNPLLHPLGYKIIEGPEISLVRDSLIKQFRILTLGGSAVMGVDTDQRNNWPWVLQMYLLQYNHDFQTVVVNGGVSGGLSFQENAQAWALRNWDFDLVIISSGYNDLYYYFMDHDHYVDSQQAVVRRFSTINLWSEKLAAQSVAFASLRHWRLTHRKMPPVSEVHRQVLTRALSPADVETFLKILTVQVRETLHRYQKQNVPVIYIAQPFLTDIMRDRPLTAYEKGIYNHYMNDKGYDQKRWQQITATVFPKMVDVYREECRREGVAFIYMEPLMRNYNGIFRDDVHLHGGGINIMGEQVARIVQQQSLHRPAHGWMHIAQTRELKSSDTNETATQVYVRVITP